MGKGEREVRQRGFSFEFELYRLYRFMVTALLTSAADAFHSLRAANQTREYSPRTMKSRVFFQRNLHAFAFSNESYNRNLVEKFRIYSTSEQKKIIPRETYPRESVLDDCWSSNNCAFVLQLDYPFISLRKACRRKLHFSKVDILSPSDRGVIR